MLVFYFVAIRRTELGAGPKYQLAPLLIKTASYMLGGPASGQAAGIVASTRGGRNMHGSHLVDV